VDPGLQSSWGNWVSPRRGPRKRATVALRFPILKRGAAPCALVAQRRTSRQKRGREDSISPLDVDDVTVSARQGIVTIRSGKGDAYREVAYREILALSAERAPCVVGAHSGLSWSTA
jgi:hypothetical protein